MDKMVIVAGPTASGKSAAGVELCKRLQGSVISADSMQVYRGMDIGSAKITEEEMQGIPHELIDIIDPSEEWNVVRFQREAKAAVQRITARGRLPVLVGGTGFYIQALLYDIDFTETREDTSYRSLLEEKARTERIRRTIVVAIAVVVDVTDVRGTLVIIPYYNLYYIL